MPLPAILAIPGLISGIFSIGEKIIDNLFPDKIAQERERAAAQQALIMMTRTADLAELQTTLSAILAEAQSADPWTSRARPTFLYTIYIFILSAIPMGIMYAFLPEKVGAVSQGVTLWLAAIPDQLWWLFGAGYLGYSATRSFDKWKSGDK
jgi:hypothetical protein